MFKVIVVSLMLVLFPRPTVEKVTPKQMFVPINCVTHLMIVDWGAGCTREGSQWMCPNAKLSFVEGCESLKPAGGAQSMKIVRPEGVEVLQ